jgi:lipopolysaccharide transport system permease protein
MLLRNSFELILYKAYADLKAEANRDYLGVLWWIIEPVLYMAVFYVFFSILRSQKNDNFIAFLLVGLVPWKWFASTVGNGAKSIVSGAGLMNQVYLPKYIFPCVVMLTNFAKFVVVFLLLLFFLVIYGIHPALVWLVVPAIVIIQFATMLAVVGILAALTPFWPDIKQVIDNALTLLFFLSGIMFNIQHAPDTIRPYLYLNPMVTLIQSYRTVLVDGHMPEWLPLAVIFLLSLIVILGAKALINRYDKTYPKMVML